MDRLSERFSYYFGLLSVFINDRNVKVDDFEHIQNLIFAEEQGLLVKLPCKVGMRIWVNGILGVGKVEEYEVIRIDYCSTLGTGKNEFYIEALLVKNPKNSIGFYDKEFDKNVFLTKDEAEKSLVESVK